MYMQSLPLKMLWKERKKAVGLMITIATTLCVSIILLQFYHNPIINYLINIFQDTINTLGYEAIGMKEVMMFYDGMYKGSMIVMLLMIFISLIVYACNYYNKTNSRIIGLLMISGYSNLKVLGYQVVQMAVITLIGYVIGIIASIILIPISQAIAYSYIGVHENIFFYALDAFMMSIPLVLMIFIFIALMQVSYAIRAVIPNLLKRDSIISFKKRKQANPIKHIFYLSIFILGIIAIWTSELNQGMVFPAFFYMYGANGIATVVIPNLLEKQIRLKKTGALRGLIYSNFILDIQQMKSIILMFIMSIVILSIMVCTNIKDYQYTILFQLGYILTNIVLSFTIVNRFKINQTNKPHYYNNLRHLGLYDEQIIQVAKQEIRLFFLTISLLVLLYIIGLSITFIYFDKMTLPVAILLILEFMIPMTIAYKITIYSERENIKRWKR